MKGACGHEVLSAVLKTVRAWALGKQLTGVTRNAESRQGHLVKKTCFSLLNTYCEYRLPREKYT